MEISKKEYEKLIKDQSKLNALEAGGVDNWEFYGDALEEWYAEDELEEKRHNLISDLEEAFGTSAYEPSERGAGVAFGDDMFDNVMAVLNEHGVIFENKATGINAGRC
tara:strand:+ start:226 stop:549 length:324 start_codon:yes stop_codon:yes gene_type:complete